MKVRGTIQVTMPRPMVVELHRNEVKSWLQQNCNGNRFRYINNFFTTIRMKGGIVEDYNDRMLIVEALNELLKENKIKIHYLFSSGESNGFGELLPEFEILR